MKWFSLYYYISAFSWNERSTDIWLVNTYTRLLACSSSNSTDSNAMKSIRSGMSYLVSYLSFIFFLKSSFSLSVLIGGGFGKGVLFSASLSSSFRRACSLGAPVNIFRIDIFTNLLDLVTLFQLLLQINDYCREKVSLLDTYLISLSTMKKKI